MTSQPPTFSPVLRRLHLTVAVLVTAQLASGLVMSPRRTPSLFLAHQMVGLAIAALVLLHWAWLVNSARDQLKNLFDYSGRSMRKAAGEMRYLLRGRSAAAGPQPGLASLVHGLGLLALTAVAGFGTGIYVLIRTHHVRSSAGEVLVDLHVFFAWVLIAYWCGHVLMAVMHEAQGDHVIARMFHIGRSAPEPSPDGARKAAPDLRD